MSFKQSKKYVEQHLEISQDEFLSKHLKIKYETSQEDFELLNLILKNRQDLMENPEIKNAVRNAIINCPENLKKYAEKLKKEEYEALTKIDRIFVWCIYNYNKFRKFIVDKFWEYRVNKSKNPLFILTEEDYGLVKFLLKNGKLHNRPVDKTVEVKANISEHATGKVVNTLYNRDFGLSDAVKIKSYNIVPGKDPLEHDYEENFNVNNSKALFTLEGELPSENDRVDDFFRCVQH